MIVITHTNLALGQFFFSTTTSQYWDGCYNNWVACPAELPMRVVPRASVPDGIVDTITKYIAYFFDGLKEIPNPDANYVPDYRRGVNVSPAKTITPEQFAAAMWFNVAGYDKDYSLKDCIIRFQNADSNSQRFWLKMANRLLDEAFPFVTRTISLAKPADT